MNAPNNLAPPPSTPWLRRKVSVGSGSCLLVTLPLGCLRHDIHPTPSNPYTQDAPLHVGPGRDQNRNKERNSIPAAKSLRRSGANKEANGNDWKATRRSRH